MGNSFSFRLKTKMTHKGLRGNKLAKMLGKTGAAVTRYLNGSAEPSYKDLLTICEALDCTPNDLLMGEDDSYSGYVVLEDGATYGSNEIEELRKENEVLMNKLAQANDTIDRIFDKKSDK